MDCSSFASVYIVPVGSNVVLVVGVTSTFTLILVLR